MPNRQPLIEDLQRVHELAAERFPQEYLDVGLGVIGLFLHDPPKNAGYRETPVNSVTFASIGVDGAHFGSITDGCEVTPESPVVLTIPMNFDEPNFIVGESLYDFLCLGCRHGFEYLVNLEVDVDETRGYYANAPSDHLDDRASKILQLLRSELSLQPWEKCASSLPRSTIAFHAITEAGPSL